MKKHLLSFGIEHLEQTGKTYIVNNKKITARKKTTNKWFETQDTISYWDDFSKQKIIYPETTQGAYFIVDDGNFFADKTCFIMLSKCPYYLLATLSSSLFEFAYKHIYSSIALGDNGYQYNKHALLLLPIISTSDLDNSISDELSVLALAALSSNSTNSKTEIINSIDKLIYDIYHITAEEIEYINNHRFLP